MLPTNELTREVEMTYEKWLRFPLRVTADQSTIDYYVDFDNPGLPVRDYRFRPNLKLVSDEEIASGFQPTKLDMHYSGEFQNMIIGYEENRQIREKSELRISQQIIDRIYDRFDPDRPLCLSEVSYRQALIQVIAVELEGGADRYEIWGSREAYIQWVVNLWRYIELRPENYTEHRLKLFTEIVLKVLPHCFEITRGAEGPLSQEEALTLLNKLREIDCLILRVIRMARPEHISVPATKNLIEGEGIKMKSNHSIMVNELGEFYPVKDQYQEETTAASNVDQRVSLATLADRGQMFRMNDEGRYVTSLGPARVISGLPYVEDITQHLTGQRRSDIVLNINVGQQQNQIDPFADSCRIKDNGRNDLKSRWRKDDINSDEDFDDDDEYDEGEMPLDYLGQHDFYQVKKRGPKADIKHLLQKHDELLRKLNHVDPFKYKKKATLEAKLRSVEDRLDAFGRAGVELPYRYRRQGWWSKLTRGIRQFGHKIGRFVRDNIESIVAVGSVAVTMLGVILRMVPKAAATSVI